MTRQVGLKITLTQGHSCSGQTSLKIPQIEAAGLLWQCQDGETFTELYSQVFLLIGRVPTRLQLRESRREAERECSPQRDTLLLAPQAGDKGKVPCCGLKPRLTSLQAG